MRRLMPSLLCLVPAVAAAQVSVDVDFDASAAVLGADERQAIVQQVQAAGRHWMQALAIDAPRSIQVRVAIDASPTANGASATAVEVPGVGGRSTYEQGVASELRTGVDPNGAAPDALITVGLAYLRNELWFDPDPLARTAPVPADRTDAQSVFLHEFGHILAYNGWADADSGQPPAGYWSVFDRWIQPGSPSRFLGPAALAAWGSAPDLTVGNIDHWGNPGQRRRRAGAWTFGVDARGAPVPPMPCTLPPSVDAPPSARRGAQAGSAGLIDQLMNGVVFYRGTRYAISALDRGVMLDVGLLAERVFADGFEAAP